MSALNPVSRLEAARVFLDEGRPDRAFARLDAPWPREFSAEASFLRGEALRAQGFFRRAQASYGRALQGLGAEERDLIVGSWLGLARCARSLGEISSARRAMRRARRACPHPDEDLSATLSLEDALVDRAAGFHAKSLRAFAPLLRASRRRGDWSAVGFLLWAAGGARRLAGDLSGSHRNFKDSLAAFRRARDQEGQTYALFGLGGISRMRGLFAEARRAYAEAGRLLGAGPDLFGRAYAHCGLANVLRQLGLLRQAQRHYRLSYALYARLDDRVDLAYVDWGLGQVHLKRGELAAAEAPLRKALAAFARGREARGEILSLHALAQVVYARGRASEAERLFVAAVRRARDAGLHTHLEIFT